MSIRNVGRLPRLLIHSNRFYVVENLDISTFPARIHFGRSKLFVSYLVQPASNLRNPLKYSASGARLIMLANLAYIPLLDRRTVSVS